MKIVSEPVMRSMDSAYTMKYEVVADWVCNDLVYDIWDAVEDGMGFDNRTWVYDSGPPWKWEV